MKGNNVSLTGNITRDAEVKRTQSGNTVVSWGLCWNSSRKNQQGGWDDIPNYFDVQAWVSDAQLNSIQGSLVKGARCAITEAHLVWQSWEDQNGNKRSKVLVQVDDVIQGMTVRPPHGSNGGYQQQPNNYTPQQQNGAYNAPQPPQNGYQQQPQQAYQQPAQQQPMQQQMQMANTSVYDDDIPF